MNHSTRLVLPASHPALAGHFPGQPIAPGVVLLDAVLTCAETWLARPLAIASLTQAKFTATLAPEQDAELQLSLTGADLKFAITRAGVAIAQGAFRLRTDEDA